MNEKRNFTKQPNHVARPASDAHKLISEQTLVTALDVWTELERLFSNARGMSLSPVWFSGVGERMGGKRLVRLEQRRIAILLDKAIEPLTLSQVIYLKERSAINLRMASDAMRLFLVANVSVPLGLIIVLNALAPTFISRLLVSIPSTPMFVAFLTVIILLVCTAWYAYAGLHQARDLYHLLSDAVARRRLFLPTTDDAQSIDADETLDDVEEDRSGDVDDMNETDISAFNM